MSKKNFKSGIDGILGGSGEVKKSPGRGRPKVRKDENVQSAKKGTKPNETRATFVVNDEQLETIKAVAYYERTSIKNVLAEALEKHFKAKKGDLNKALDMYKKNKRA